MSFEPPGTQLLNYLSTQRFTFRWSAPSRKHITILLWTIAAVSLWIRSHYHADTLYFTNKTTTVAMGLSEGELVLVALTSTPFTPPTLIGKNREAGLHFAGPPWDFDKRYPAIRPQFLGFGFRPNSSFWIAPTGSPIVTIQPYDFKQQKWRNPPNIGVNVIANGHAITLPFWFITLLPVIAAPLRKLFRKRRDANTCPHCRYDLRATPTRCPECGHQPTPLTQPPAPPAP